MAANATAALVPFTDFISEKTMTDQKWAVLGASGFVGSAVVTELKSSGFEVVELSAPRLSSSASEAANVLATGLSLAAEPSKDFSALVESLAGVDGVINAAGLATPGDGGSAQLTGANALLPLVVSLAAAEAGAHRFIHLSSASVQGQSSVIDESPRRAPFSAYSRSKALGEEALELVASTLPSLNIVTVRATSVQGSSRPTTQSLVRVAKSPLASVAGDGSAATPVSSINALAWFVGQVAQHPTQVPGLVLQPWEGMNVEDVLFAAGGRKPLHIPRAICTAVLKTGYALSGMLGQRMHGPIRRVELMWFGQQQTPGWAESVGLVPDSSLKVVLEEAR